MAMLELPFGKKKSLLNHIAVDWSGALVCYGKWRGDAFSLTAGAQYYTARLLQETNFTVHTTSE